MAVFIPDFTIYTAVLRKNNSSFGGIFMQIAFLGGATHAL